MRKKSADKYEALLKATLTLINNNGFHDAPMSKIAKVAGVSPATIYLYFENKQDLISKLYLETKGALSKHAFLTYNEDMPVKKGFEIIWHNIADYTLNQIDEAIFLLQCDNTPMITEEIREEGLKHLQPLLNLWSRGTNEGIIKPVSPYILYAYSIYPLSFLLAASDRNHFKLTKISLQEAFQAAWDAIKV